MSEKSPASIWSYTKDNWIQHPNTIDLPEGQYKIIVGNEKPTIPYDADRYNWIKVDVYAKPKKAMFGGYNITDFLPNGGKIREIDRYNGRARIGYEWHHFKDLKESNKWRI